jgi:hypothetical protein
VRAARLAAIVLAILVATGPARANAQASAADSALAESLFDEGVALMARGDFDHACPKLAESQRLDPGGGTLLNLARCYEAQKKTASAWATYRAALGVARNDAREDRIRYAEEHLAALEPLLPRLVVRIAQPAPALELRVDGTRVGSAAWGTPQPVDPGRHVVRATAPGRAAFTAETEIREGETSVVDVPPLARAIGAGGPEEDGPHASRDRAVRGRTHRVVGASLTVAGAGGMVTGAVLGILALGQSARADRLCPGNAPCTDAGGLDASDRAQTFATGATVSLVAGAALIAAGVVLLITAPRARD